MPHEELPVPTTVSRSQNRGHAVHRLRGDVRTHTHTHTVHCHSNCNPIRFDFNLITGQWSGDPLNELYLGIPLLLRKSFRSVMWMGNGLAAGIKPPCVTSKACRRHTETSLRLNRKGSGASHRKTSATRETTDSKLSKTICPHNRVCVCAHVQFCTCVCSLDCKNNR